MTMTGRVMNVVYLSSFNIMKGNSADSDWFAAKSILNTQVERKRQDKTVLNMHVGRERWREGGVHGHN